MTDLDFTDEALGLGYRSVHGMGAFFPEMAGLAAVEMDRRTYDDLVAPALEELPQYKGKINFVFTELTPIEEADGGIVSDWRLRGGWRRVELFPAGGNIRKDRVRRLQWEFPFAAWQSEAG